MVAGSAQQDLAASEGISPRGSRKQDPGLTDTGAPSPVCISRQGCLRVPTWPPGLASAPTKTPLLQLVRGRTVLHVGLPLSATRLWPCVPTSGSGRSPGTHGARADPKEADSARNLTPPLPGQPQLRDLQGLHCTPTHPCRQSAHEPCSWGRGQEGKCQALPAPCAHSLGPVTAELPHHPFSPSSDDVALSSQGGKGHSSCPTPGRQRVAPVTVAGGSRRQDA